MFITLEGIEGSGKSTLAKALAEKIKKGLNKETILTREPGGTEFGKNLRSLLLDRRDLTLNSTAETLLFAADRAQHIHEIILPALSAGKVVISDRFYHSTLAYQGYGRGLDLEMLRKVCSIATENKNPDLVVLLDLPVEEGLKRAKSRAENWTKFEEEEINFHKNVRIGFLELAKESPELFLVLDATKSPEELVNLAWKKICK